MINNKKFTALFITLFAITFAKNSVAANFTGSASVLLQQQVIVSELNQINFGTITIGTDADVVTLSPNGDISSLTGATITNGTSAAFTAVGTPDANITISFQNGSLSGPGQIMTIQNFQHNGGVSFDNLGVITFNVGADLVIPENQTAGSYSGNYVISVDYP